MSHTKLVLLPTTSLNVDSKWHLHTLESHMSSLLQATPRNGHTLSPFCCRSETPIKLNSHVSVHKLLTSVVSESWCRGLSIRRSCRVLRKKMTYRWAFGTKITSHHRHICSHTDSLSLTCFGSLSKRHGGLIRSGLRWCAYQTVHF